MKTKLFFVLATVTLTLTLFTGCSSTSGEYSRAPKKTHFALEYPAYQNDLHVVEIEK